MIGLILKDFFTQKKNLRTMLIFSLIFVGVFGFFNGQIGFVSSFILFFASILSLSAFSFDKYCSWDNYALTLPISRNKIVAARYLTVLLLMCFAAAIAVLLILLLAQFKDTSPWEFITSIYIMISFLLILLSVTLPIIYKFGIEHGRLLMIGLILVPFMIIQIAINSGLQLPSAQLVKLLSVFSLPCALVCYGLSYNIAAKIYLNKEF